MDFYSPPRSAARTLCAAVSFIDINLTFAWVSGAYRALLSLFPTPPLPFEGQRERRRGAGIVALCSESRQLEILERVVRSTTTAARAALAIHVFQFIPPGWRN